MRIELQLAGNHRASGELINRFLAELDKESDRSAVLIACAAIEEILEAHLREYFQHGPKAILDSLFNGSGGTLSTFSAKIDSLCGLGGIPEICRNRLHALRKLRNKCAHSWEGFKFDGSFDVELLRNIEAQEFTEGFRRVVSDTLKSPLDQVTFSLRERFELATAALVMHCSFRFDRGNLQKQLAACGRAGVNASRASDSIEEISRSNPKGNDPVRQED